MNPIKRYNKERDAAVSSFNVETFKAFARKWGLPMPPTDKVIEITMRKMACHINSLSEETKAEARKWLLDRGYTDSFGE